MYGNIKLMTTAHGATPTEACEIRLFMCSTIDKRCEFFLKHE